MVDTTAKARATRNHRRFASRRSSGGMRLRYVPRATAGDDLVATGSRTRPRARYQSAMQAEAQRKQTPKLVGARTTASTWAVRKLPAKPTPAAARFESAKNRP